MVPAAAAEMRSGMAWARAFNRTSTMRWEVSTLPPATAECGLASRRCPGAKTRMDASARRHWMSSRSRQRKKAKEAEENGFHSVNGALNLRIGAGEVDGDGLFLVGGGLQVAA